MWMSATVHEISTLAVSAVVARAAHVRLILPLLLLLLLGTFAPASLFRAPPLPPRITLAAKPVALHSEQPKLEQTGRLLFLAGWELRSNDPRFGGISAMHVEDDRVLAASDSGYLFRFPAPGTAPLRLTITALGGGPGTGETKFDRDVESMIVDGDDLWMGFEGANAIWRYDRRDLRPISSARPPAMRGWPGNGGPEAMLKLPGGGTLVFAEDADLAGGTTQALLFEGHPIGNGEVWAMAYRGPAGYRITDAAMLRDGTMLFLNRRVGLTGFTAKLTLREPALMDRQEVIEGREIASLAPPLTVDNMEAISITYEGGQPIVWLASDDNYGGLQRTLLLKFALN